MSDKVDTGLNASHTQTEWQERLATITPDFMHNLSGDFPVKLNKILSNIINRIGLTIIEGAEAPPNVFEKYTRELMPAGEIIQKIKIPIGTGEKFDCTKEDPFGRRVTQPYPLYAWINKEHKYVTTIHDTDFQKAFSSLSTLGSYVSGLMDELQKRLQYDKYILWKEYFSKSRAIKYDKIVAPNSVSENDFADMLIKKLREYANENFRFMSRSYNFGDKSLPPKSGDGDRMVPITDQSKLGDVTLSGSIDIIIPTKHIRHIEEYLKDVYNINKMHIEANIIKIDDFDPLTASDLPKEDASNYMETLAIIADERAFDYYPTLITAESQRNGESLYTNHFLHSHGLYCVNKYRNAVRLIRTAA